MNEKNKAIHQILAKNSLIQIELGEKFYAEIAKTHDYSFTEEDYVNYFKALGCRTFDGYLREKSVINDGLAKYFPSIAFEESDPELDHAGDIDYIGRVGEKAFGVQIKPITAKSNFGNYSISERMKASFQDFETQFGGKVFMIFSLDGEIANKEILKDIESQINRLK